MLFAIVLLSSAKLTKITTVDLGCRCNITKCVSPVESGNRVHVIFNYSKYVCKVLCMQYVSMLYQLGETRVMPRISKALNTAL